jgi:hypothetical protein
VLIHFKTFIHINTILTENYAMFKPFEYLHPSKLRIRFPSTLSSWSSDASTSTVPGEEPLLVSDLSQSGVPGPRLYGLLGPLVAWDFTTGMILGCFISRQPDENYAAVLKRARPFLFMHKSHFAVDGTDIEAAT